MRRLIRGDKLNPAALEEVLASYGYRWTCENATRAAAWNGIEPRPNLPSDQEWLAAHAFYVTKAGRLDARCRHCEPHYMAEEG